MKQIILARRYAKALFAVGTEGDKQEEYGQALKTMHEIYLSTPDVVDALTNPLYPTDIREKVMGGLIENIVADKVMVNFLNLLVEKKRAEILPEISEEYQAMVNDAKNISHGTVTSAIELSDELQSKVQETLEKLTGRKVILTAQVDTSIIGGVVAKVGDLVLDGSIKTQLASLKDSIKGRE